MFDWIVSKVEEFIDQLEVNLPRVTEGASINTLLNQSMYFGMSMGRVGIDFRGKLQYKSKKSKKEKIKNKNKNKN